jgi:type IV pilus assembly protein PilV
MSAVSMRRQQGGIALIESLVAVLLLAIGLLGAIGLQARASAALIDAGMRAEATMSANDLLNTIAVDFGNVADYNVLATGTPSARLLPWYTATKNRIPSGVIAVAITVNASPAPSRVDITISWTRKKNTPQKTYHLVAYVAPSA